MESPTPTQVPPIPKLQGEIILEVFTHRSLRFHGAPLDQDSEYGDNERLAVLGEKVLEAAVTDALFRQRPMLKGTDIEVGPSIPQPRTISEESYRNAGRKF